LTSFTDLDECTYARVNGARTLAVGWLDTGVNHRQDPERQPPPKPVVFVRAEPSREFIEQLVLVTKENLDLGRRAAGYHVCNLPDCERTRGLRVVRGLGLGSWQTWVRHPREPRTLFCAPNLVLHYVVDHHYLPPRDFIGAVMAYRPGDLPIVDEDEFRLRLPEEPLPARESPWRGPLDSLSRDLSKLAEPELRRQRCSCGGNLWIAYTRTAERAYSLLECLSCSTSIHLNHGRYRPEYAPLWAREVGPKAKKVIVTGDDVDHGVGQSPIH
jgi:hypothetical protein